MNSRVSHSQSHAAKPPFADLSTEEKAKFVKIIKELMTLKCRHEELRQEKQQAEEFIAAERRHYNDQMTRASHKIAELISALDEEKQHSAELRSRNMLQIGLLQLYKGKSIALLDTLRESRSQYVILQSKHAALEKCLTELEDVVAMQQKTIESYADTTQICNDLKQKVEDMSQVITEKDESMVKLSEKNRGLEMACAELTKQITFLQSSLAEKAHRCIEFENEISSFLSKGEGQLLRQGVQSGDDAQPRAQPRAPKPNTSRQDSSAFVASVDSHVELGDSDLGAGREQLQEPEYIPQTDDEEGRVGSYQLDRRQGSISRIKSRKPAGKENMNNPRREEIGEGVDGVGDPIEQKPQLDSHISHVRAVFPMRPLQPKKTRSSQSAALPSPGRKDDIDILSLLPHNTSPLPSHTPATKSSVSHSKSEGAISKRVNFNVEDGLSLASSPASASAGTKSMRKGHGGEGGGGVGVGRRPAKKKESSQADTTTGPPPPAPSVPSAPSSKATKPSHTNSTSGGNSSGSGGGTSVAGADVGVGISAVSSTWKSKPKPSTHTSPHLTHHNSSGLEVELGQNGRYDAALFDLLATIDR